MSDQPKRVVAVVGAGPAGLFAAKELASQGVRVVVFNRDIKPGGLAEYGIYPEKIRMKAGLRAQFRQILSMPEVDYYGMVKIGQNADFSLDQLRYLGFEAILVAAGAQGTKWLGLEGEDLAGVYHAKDIVYHYNKLPPFSQRKLNIGKRVAIIGVGNVMMDIARYLISELKVDEVTAIARRGPAEVKFDRREMETVIANLDIDAYEHEIDRVSHIMQSLGQHPQVAKDTVRNALEKAVRIPSNTHFTLHFMASPVRILGNENHQVTGLELEANTLVSMNGQVKAKGLGAYHYLDVDTVIFAIGDKVDDKLGLPVHNSEFDKNPEPRFPVDGESYEAYHIERKQPLEGVFVAGWSRNASQGLVGIARKDGANGAKAILQYLQTTTSPVLFSDAQLLDAIRQLRHPVVTKDHLLVLEEEERNRAQRLGLEDFKFMTNQEMLEVIGNVQPVS